ncbi:MAG: FkbM family methyltransferase [Alphaproteobacteria bacterium]
MNLKYFLGAGYFRTIEAVVSLPAFPLTRYFPRGVFWMFDIQRFLETRSLGVLFDVGANVGQTLKTLLRHAPDAKIYGFEPAVETFRVLQANFGDRRNVDLRNVALGAHPDRRVLQLSEDSQLNTLMPRDTQGVCGATQMTEVATIDDIVAAEDISHLDLLKIDVQGWEMEVLRGAGKLIAEHNLIFIYTEVAFRSDATEMQQFGELHDHLERNGFALCGFYEGMKFGPRKEFLGFSNALYIHPAARLKWTGIGME